MDKLTQADRDRIFKEEAEKAGRAYIKKCKEIFNFTDTDLALVAKLGCIKHNLKAGELEDWQFMEIVTQELSQVVRGNRISRGIQEILERDPDLIEPRNRDEYRKLYDKKLNQFGMNMMEVSKFLRGVGEIKDEEKFMDNAKSEIDSMFDDLSKGDDNA